MKKIAFTTVAAILFFLPLLASAQNLPNVWDPASIKGPLVSCVGIYPQANGNGSTIANPSGLPACEDLCDLIYTIMCDIYIAIAFVIWIILPIMFVAGGIMYMMGGANPNLLTTAKSTLKGAVIGAVIVLCAYLLIATFVKFMAITGIGGFPDANGNTPPACDISV
jgi:hypothetical protein